MFNKFGFFWYSAEQKERQNRFDSEWRCFCKPIIGGIAEYTEWSSSFPFRPSGNFKDYRLAGIGFFHHTEGARYWL